MCIMIPGTNNVTSKSPVGDMSVVTTDVVKHSNSAPNCLRRGSQMADSQLCLRVERPSCRTALSPCLWVARLV